MQGSFSFDSELNFFKVHATNALGYLKDAMDARGWKYFEDGHSQLNAIIITPNGKNDEKELLEVLSQYHIHK